nr:MAG TPA: tail assembly chaperone protein [Caudoviricetes sp.]
MSQFNRFMKENKIKKSNTTYAATKSLVDENGKPLLWTIKAITTAENDIIREDCTKDIPVTGKPNMFRPKLNTSKYIAKMICASVVEPNLNDKELQDSYGVMTADELLKEMVDNPGEYGDFAAFVQKFNGFEVSLEDKVEEAKN